MKSQPLKRFTVNQSIEIAQNGFAHFQISLFPLYNEYLRAAVQS
jgi:hypothetical protein